MDEYNAGHYLEALKQFTILLEKNKDNIKLISEIMYTYINNIYDKRSLMHDEDFMNWLKEEANNGNSFAQNNLGFMYEHGLGVHRDFKEAMRWYERAANSGESYAQRI